MNMLNEFTAPRFSCQAMRLLRLTDDDARQHHKSADLRPEGDLVEHRPVPGEELSGAGAQAYERRRHADRRAVIRRCCGWGCLAHFTDGMAEAVISQQLLRVSQMMLQW